MESKTQVVRFLGIKVVDGTITNHDSDICQIYYSIEASSQRSLV